MTSRILSGINKTFEAKKKKKQNTVNQTTTQSARLPDESIADYQERQRFDAEVRARSKARREREAREREAREQEAREQAAREQAAREREAREQAAREQAAREREAREQAAREQAAREQAARERAAAKLTKDIPTTAPATSAPPAPIPVPSTAAPSTSKPAVPITKSTDGAGHEVSQMGNKTTIDTKPTGTAAQPTDEPEDTLGAHYRQFGTLPEVPYKEDRKSTYESYLAQFKKIIDYDE